MRPERAFLGGAAVVAAVALVAALALPGAIAAPAQEIRRPGPVNVAEVTVQPGEVSGATAELSMQAQVEHRGNPTPNVTVRFRAVDAESGFLAAEKTVELGTLRDEGWNAANTTLRLDRAGGYVLVTTVFRDGEPVDEARRRVRGMDALTPAYARTPIEFSDRGSVPTVSVSVAGAGDQRTTLDVTSRLTNQGDEAAGGLTMVVVVRQAESNVVADEASTEVGRIRAGRTARVGTTVEVPAGYNYYVDVELYRDGVLIDAAQGVANLDPKKQVEADTVEKDVQFNVSEFERSGSGGDRGRPAGSPTEVSTPGFGPAVVLVALLAAAVIVLTRRRR